MPASSMLLFVLVMWSVPVIIYVVLFFQELKQIGRGPRSIVSRHRESDDAGNVSPFEYLLPMVAAATIALMFGLFVAASWPVCLMLMGAGAALIGGVAYTVLQMHSLGIPKEARSPDRAPRRDPSTRIDQLSLVNSPAANPGETPTNTSHTHIMKTVPTSVTLSL